MGEPYFSAQFKPAHEVQEEYRPPSHVVCKYCANPIFLGDKSVFIHHGEIGKGKKSGQPLVIDSEHSSGEAVVHELCAISYLTTSVVDSSEEAEAVIDSITAEMFGLAYSELLDDDKYCSVCEANLSGDDD